MHSSRMRTDRGSLLREVSAQSGLCPGGVSVWGLCPGGLCPGRGVSDSRNKSSPELDALPMLITLPSFVLASATIHLKMCLVQSHLLGDLLKTKM